MSQHPEDRTTTRTQRDAKPRMSDDPGQGTMSQPTVPTNRPDPTSGRSAAPLSGALLWTVGILLVVAVVAILWFAL
jgi:hypothetical protein